MERIGELWRRLTFLLRRRQLDRDLDEEMRFHLEMKAEAHGEHAARRRFGNITLLKEDARGAWGWRWLDTLARDYNPQLAEHYPAVTLRHLATMTSGIDGVGGSYDRDPAGRGDANALVAPAPPFFPPGTKYQYWDEATQHYRFGPIDWSEFEQVLAGHGPCNRERMEARRKAHEDGRWVREAALAWAAKREAAARAA